MIRALFLLLPLWATAQTDARWRLLPDSSVVVPFADLRTAAANRLTSDMMTRMAVREVVALSREASSLRTAYEAEHAVNLSTGEALNTCEAQRLRITEERDQWSRKAKRRGVVVAVAVSVAVALILTQ